MSGPFRGPLPGIPLSLRTETIDDRFDGPDLIGGMIAVSWMPPYCFLADVCTCTYLTDHPLGYLGQLLFYDCIILCAHHHFLRG